MLLKRYILHGLYNLVSLVVVCWDNLIVAADIKIFCHLLDTSVLVLNNNHVIAVNKLRIQIIRPIVYRKHSFCVLRTVRVCVLRQRV